MRHILLLIVALGCSCRTSPTPEATAPEGIFVALKGVTVIDGKGNAPAPNRVVLLREDRIVDILDAQTYRENENTRVFDLAGHYIMPGLIDMHAHVTILPMGENGELGSRMDRDVSERVLRLLLGFGITTVRNPAAPTEDGVALREGVRVGDIPGPRVLTSGYALNRRTSGPFLGVRTAEEIRDEVRRQVEAGVDFIKVYSALPPEIIKAAVDEAHIQDVRVVGHLQRTTWTEAARFGIDAITHAAPWSPSYLPPDKRAAYDQTLKGRIYWLNHLDLESEPVEEMVTALVEHGVTIDPTLISLHTKFWGDDPRYLDHPYQSVTPPSILAMWRRGSFTSDWTRADYTGARAAWPKMLAFVKLLHDRGVLLTTGSDIPNPWVIPGISLHEELRLLAAAGIPKLEVLRIATHNGAVALGLDGQIGSVEIGKRADLIVLTDDPIQDLKHTQSIKWVIRNGTLVSPETLLQKD